MNLTANIHRFFILEESREGDVFEQKTAEKLRTESCALLWKKRKACGKGDRKWDLGGMYRLGVTVTWR